jgi:hypothetical protein
VSEETKATVPLQSALRLLPPLDELRGVRPIEGEAEDAPSAQNMHPVESGRPRSEVPDLLMRIDEKKLVVLLPNTAEGRSGAENPDVSVTHWAGQYVSEDAWPRICGPEGYTDPPVTDAEGKRLGGRGGAGESNWLMMASIGEANKRKGGTS